MIELIFFYNFHQNAATHFVSVFLFFNFFPPSIRVKDGLVPLCHCSKIISIIRTGMMKPKNQMRHNKFCFHLGCIAAVFSFFFFLVFFPVQEQIISRATKVKQKQITWHPEAAFYDYCVEIILIFTERKLASPVFVEFDWPVAANTTVTY